MKPGFKLPGDGLKLVSRALDQWACRKRVTLDFSCPGRPTDNAFLISFIGRLRQECLNTNWFLSPNDARDEFEVWGGSSTMNRVRTVR